MMFRWLLFALAMLSLRPSPALGEPANAPGVNVDSTIITGIDVSDSISDVELLIQVEGIGQAIQAPEVMTAIQSGRVAKIGFLVFLWADGDFPIVAGWSEISTLEDATDVAQRMMAAVHEIRSSGTSRVGSLTDVSAALQFAGELLAHSPFVAEQNVINLISNGVDNVDSSPEQVRDHLVSQGVRINGVVIGGLPAIVTYFRESVIGGPSAFVVPVTEREGLVYALCRKFRWDLAQVQP